MVLPWTRTDYPLNFKLMFILISSAGATNGTPRANTLANIYFDMRKTGSLINNVAHVNEISLIEVRVMCCRDLAVRLLH